MYNIIVEPIICRIEPQLPSEVLIKLNETLRYRPDGYQHTWAFKNKRSDGYKYLFDMRKQCFRSGLLGRVRRKLDQVGIECTIVDQRRQKDTIPDFSCLSVDPLVPFEYQMHAAEATRGQSHGIIASPTGTGKTLSTALIVRQHAKRTLIMVNSRVLLDQTWEYFDSILSGKVGIVGSGDFDLQEITIATTQSLASILGVGKKQDPTDKAPVLRQWLDGVGLVICDEVHEADSDSIAGLCAVIPADSFIGTTATPFAWANRGEKGSNLEMEQHFGQKIFDSRDEADFIKLGVTVPLCIVRFLTPVKCMATKALNPRSGEGGVEYRDVINEQVIQNDERTALIAQRARDLITHGLSCYVYYSRIAYGEMLCKAMSDLDPIMLKGETSRAVRTEAFRDINDKKRLLAVSDIGSYGLNIRSLDSLIIATPVKDSRQLVGRVCRASPSKQFGYVYDPVDDVPFLKYHSQLRLNQYNKDKHNVVG